MEEKDYRADGAAEQPSAAPDEALEVTETENTAAADAEVAGAASEEEPCAEVPLSWSFGAGQSTSEPSRKARGAGRFAGVFAAVVAVTLALLVVLLLLGDTGIRIYRTLTYERTVFVREEDTDGTMLSPEEAAALVRASTVTVSVKHTDAQGIGSGFIYTADGYICTNHHVIEDALEVQVILPTGEAVDATVVGSDEAADVAMLKIDKTGLTPVKLGSSAAALVGESVVAIGTPYSLEYSGTATFGKISYTNRLLPIKDSAGNVTKVMRVIQTDTPVNNGNSGGPLANMYGEVIGVVVMKLATSGTTVFDSIGFALPIDGVKTIADAIIRDGSFTGENPIASPRSLLGVTGRGLKGGYWYSDPAAEMLTESQTEVQGYFHMPVDGVYVTAVSGQNSAGKIKSGDIIVKIDGLRMYNIYDVIGAVNRHQAGETVKVTLMRPSGSTYTELTVDIVLAGG